MLDDQEWRQLCEQASREQDPDRLLQLVERINNILEERERRLRERTRGNSE